MARIIQVLLPLVCVVLAQAQLQMPFSSQGLRENRPTRKNLGYNSGYDTWFQNFGNPDVHLFNSDSHRIDKAYEVYDPFYHGDQGNGWNQLPWINNLFNIPNPGYNGVRHQLPHKDNPQEKPKQDHNDFSNVQKPEEKSKEIPPIDKTSKEHNKGLKLNENNIPEVKNKLNEAISDVKNNSDLLPPKTNDIKEDKKTNEIEKDNKTNDIIKDKNEIKEDKKANEIEKDKKTNDIIKDKNEIEEDKKANEIEKDKKTNDIIKDKNEIEEDKKANEIEKDKKTNEIKKDKKTNDIKKEDEKKDKDNKHVDKNKDFFLVGQDNNGNIVYLLHESNPNPNIVVTPNGDQPGNNIIYVPYNPGQTNTPVYQVINGQPVSLPTNVQGGNDQVGVSSGYNNVIPNPGHSNTNLNTGNQNPGYVTIYSNGELIQMPGVVVNSAPNNVPLQNGNQVQETNDIIANTVPNNVQTVPAIQNPGTNVVYATIPNHASNGPIYVQVPNCDNAVSNGCGSSTVQGVNNGISNNGLPSNVNTVAQPAVLPNDVAYGYVQPMVANQGQGPTAIAIPNQGVQNQNGPYQQAFELPVNSGLNGYNQPIVFNLGQGQNALNQADLTKNKKYQNIPIQTAVQLPVENNNNGYNQPVVTNQGQGLNIPYQGAILMPSTTSNNGYYQPTVSSQRPEVNAPNQEVIYYQYMPTQPAVQTPIYNGINGYVQPMVSNQAQGPNDPNQGVIVNNQHTPLQPAVEIPIPNGYNVYPPVTNPSPAVTVESLYSNQNMQPLPVLTVNSGSNGYQQPQVPNQGDQGTNAIVIIPNNGEVINQDFDNAQPLATSTLVLDSINLSSLGAVPAIMIADFKDKSGDKKDKKKSKHKIKKPKEDEKPKVLEPFTNKMEDVKR